jgi:hypothetical protein
LSSTQEEASGDHYRLTPSRQSGRSGVHDDHDEDSVNPHEQTIRPISRKDDRSLQPPSYSAAAAAALGIENSKMQIVTKLNQSRSIASPASATTLTPRSPNKPPFGSKFELPSRPDLFYREETIDDFSDLNIDNDLVFVKRGLQIRQPMSAKVSWRAAFVEVVCVLEMVGV